MVDLAVFLLFGIPLLTIGWLKDSYHFAIELYRSDIKKIGCNDDKDEYFLNEAQFITLETFISDEYRKL